MPKGQGLKKAKLIDWWGLATGSVAIICLLIPLSGGGSYFAWSSALVIAMLTIGGVAAIAFVLVEWKVSKLPMVPSKYGIDPPRAWDWKLMLSSGHVQKHGRVCNLGPELPLRILLLRWALFYPTISSECPWCNANRVRCTPDIARYSTSHSFSRIWILHFKVLSIRRSDLGWLYLLDAVSLATVPDMP